jgi:hypothetical protein
MFFEPQSARDPEEVVNMFEEFFQDVYVNEDEPVSLPKLDTLLDEESHKVSLVQLTSWTNRMV